MPYTCDLGNFHVDRQQRQKALRRSYLPETMLHEPDRSITRPLAFVFVCHWCLESKEDEILQQSFICCSAKGKDDNRAGEGTETRNVEATNTHVDDIYMNMVARLYHMYFIHHRSISRITLR